MRTYPGVATVEIDGAAVVAAVAAFGVVPLPDVVGDPPADVAALIRDWDRWAPELRELAAAAGAAAARGPETVRWLPPLVPAKLLCVGSNYHDHVAEMAGPAGLEQREAPFPFSFLKPPTALVGSGATVARPSYGHKLDWEAELAVVIGDPAEAGGDDPLRAVFGYTIVNDLSLRDFLPFPHTLGLDAVVSKGFDGAAPLGPFITPRADVTDPQDLPVRLSVNGEVQQDGTTANMIFGVADLVRHYARVMTLQPGDVIATGTPAGVGAGRRPPRFLKDGDRIEISIGDLGTLSTTIAPPSYQAPLGRTASAASTASGR
ncbi:fumarylacetoacetate hydrolase family protein [Amycolatopsis sp. cmx-4-68]|uniref:fumarylacetoacetate hydrolase family protein n=1 Tax=Amycolatopsis sp. cmx-4-68 TaxID=2790938 RepID=UPI0039789980